MRLRRGVVGVFVDSQGKVLVCERSTLKGAWQFPQGGIDDGEDEDIAISREMSEELGCNDFQVLKKSDICTKYFFPPNSKFPIAKTHDGQIHRWFMLEFTQGSEPDLTRSDGEFIGFRWVSVAQAIQDVVEWKRDSYIEGLRALGLNKD